MADWTEADLEAINKAIANGTTEVRFGDRTVRYRSLAEMIQIKSMIARDLNKTQRPNRVLASFSKGLAK